MAIFTLFQACFFIYCVLYVRSVSATVRNDCDVQIIVSPGNSVIGRSCDRLSATSTQCGSLDGALSIASSNITSLNCTQISLQSGQYIITSVYSFEQNIVLSGTKGQVYVNFTVDPSIQDSFDLYQPLYLLEFISVDYVGISGIVFRDSPGIIGIQNATQVVIENCEFSYFTEGSIDIYDTINIIVFNCTFQHNGPVTNVLKRLPYSIHSGAMSIVMDNLPNDRSLNVEPEIRITDCVFINNSAVPTSDLIRSTNDIFQRNIFTGRGGALGVTLHSPNKTIYCYVENCLFERNEANVWGGGMYVIFGTGSNHTLVTKECTFMYNNCTSAGGLFVGTLETGTLEIFSSSYILDCQFLNNTAFIGGANVWPVPGIPSVNKSIITNLARYENCSFIGNKADLNSALSFVTVDTFNTQTSHRSVEIVNCTFIDNEAKDSPALSSAFVPLLFEGNNIFDRNKGGAIELVGSIAAVKGYIMISNTQTIGSNKGAFYVSSFGQIMLHRGADIEFINNTGSFGAALISESLSLSLTFQKLLYNPLCFLLYEDIRATPNQWNDVRMSFTGNKAIVGSAAYVDILDSCSWSQLKRPFFDASQVLRWNFIEFGENINSFHDTNMANPLWYVQTSAYDIDSIDSTIQAYPGEEFPINITVVDELFQPVAAPVRTLGLKTAGDDGHVSLSLRPEVGLYINRSDTLRKRAYIHSGEDITDSYTLELRNIFSLRTQSSNVQIDLDECPPGFVLTSVAESADFHACQCNHDNQYIVTCTNRSPMFESSLWATKDISQVDQLSIYSCPNGYCSCTVSQESANECLYSYDSTDPDDQCSCKREGILCGQCRNGAGVSALLNTCTTCHDTFSILVVALVIIDSILLIVILRFFISVNCPALLLPCIFYIQFLPFGTEVFQKDFQTIRPYLFYVASAMSFYFPYDFCLYSSMSSVVAYTFKMIPLILALIITPIVLFVCWYFVKSIRNKNWNFVWILVLLLYPHSVHTAFNILNCPLIRVNGTLDSRWYIDGSVQCFRGGHAPLGLLAIIVLFISIAIIPVTVLLAYKDFENPVWLRKLQIPLRIWFKYKWWYGIELGRRFILLLAAIPFPGNRHAVFITFCINMGLFLYVRPYTTPTANWLDFFFSIITFFLYLLFLPDTPVLFNESSFINDGCSDAIETYSAFSIMGGILYYTPLVTSIVVLIIWGIIKIYHKAKTSRPIINLRHSSAYRNHAASEALEVSSKRTTYLNKDQDGEWIHAAHSGSVLNEQDTEDTTTTTNTTNTNVTSYRSSKSSATIEMRKSILDYSLNHSTTVCEQSTHLNDDNP